VWTRCNQHFSIISFFHVIGLWLGCGLVVTENLGDWNLVDIFFPTQIFFTFLFFVIGLRPRCGSVMSKKFGDLNDDQNSVDNFPPLKKCHFFSLLGYDQSVEQLWWKILVICWHCDQGASSYNWKFWLLRWQLKIWSIFFNS
jgi:hypothetical protein